MVAGDGDEVGPDVLGPAAVLIAAPAAARFLMNGPEGELRILNVVLVPACDHAGLAARAARAVEMKGVLSLHGV